ncbi:MAG: 6-carboxytetrahydropterin synthase QueD [Candidatus Altiarchaeota archaeon]|nr:6-carboxytetrahydropterin synthase QueD [Candidatus Altiarchaeota archaeon]
MRLCREFYFDSSHFLPNYKGKCETMHGHTYKLEIVVEGEIGNDGMVMDFHKIGDVVEKEVIDKIDHKILNDIIENPTAENIIVWVRGMLDGKLPLYSIKLWEGKGKWAELVCR